MLQDKKKLYHRVVVVLCLAAAILGLCWISNIKREETVSVSDTYNIGAAINELEWKELGESELNLYLTETSGENVGEFLSLLSEDDYEHLNEETELLDSNVLVSTFVYDEETRSYQLETETEYGFTEYCTLQYEETRGAESAEDSELREEQVMTAEPRLSARGITYGKWQFDTNSEVFYISDSSRTTTYRYELRGLKGKGITEEDQRPGRLTIKISQVRYGNAFSRPKITGMKEYLTGVNAGEVKYYNTAGELVDVSTNPEIENTSSDNGELFYGLSLQFGEVFLNQQGYHYDANNISIYAYNTDHPAYSYNHIYDRNGKYMIDSGYITDKNNCLREESRVNFNELNTGLRAEATMKNENGETKKKEVPNVSRISDRSSFNAASGTMTINGDLMFLSGTVLKDSIQGVVAVESDEAEFVLNMTPNTYNITLDANWGTLYDYINTNTWTNITTVPVTYDASYYDNIGGTQPKRDGFVFDGWYTEREGGIQVWDKDGQAVNGTGFWQAGKWCHTSSVTIFAHWKPAIKNTWVVLDANWGSLYDYINTNSWTNVTSFYTEGGKNYYDDISRTVPKRDGFTFAGWYIDIQNTENGRNNGVPVWDRNGKAINGTGFWQDGKWICTETAVTAFAHWVPEGQPLPEAHKLTVRPNGGGWNGYSTDQTFTMEEGSTKAIVAPQRTGYNFTGWTLSGAGSSMNGTTFTMGTADATLTAGWAQSTHQLTVNPNGGTWNGSGSSQAFALSAGSTKTIVNPTWTGHTFTGWQLSGNGSSINGTTFTMGNADATLMAGWELNSYNVRLIAGIGVKSVTGAGNHTYQSDVTISAALYPGYHWKNWTGTYSSESITYNFKMPAGDVEMTANGEANTYTVRYEGNGADSGSMADSQHTYDVAKNLSMNSYTRTGYTFTGWNRNPDGSGEGFTDGQSVKNLTAENHGVVTLYAQWRPNRYTIVFDPNGGAGHMDDIQTQYDADVTLPNGADAYKKYTLDGVNVTDAVISGAYTFSVFGEELEEEEESTEEGAEDPEDPDAQTGASEETETGETPETEEAEEILEEADMDQEVTAALPDDPEGVTALEGEEGAERSVPVQRAYPSVFMGWSLADGKDSFIPQWKTGDVVRNLTAEDNGVVTLYAVWDDCPWIQAQDLYYSLEQAQNGFITELEILSHATASDREDGSPIDPGFHDNGTSFSIPDYQESDFTQFQHEGSVTENLTVVDSVGSVYSKQITVHIVDTTPTVVEPEGTTRFISEKYFNSSYENGGLEDNSVWKTDPEYRAALQSAFNNLKNDTPVQTYSFSREQILEMQEFISTNWIGNSKSPDALSRFYDKFIR